MKAALFLSAFPLYLTSTLASTFHEGKVVSVSDGDTLTLLTSEKKQIKIRLAGIDTPESKQPYGNRAKQALSDLAFGKQTHVVVQDIDRYGRTVGRVYVDGIIVNAELVHQGAAWVYRQYAKEKYLFTLKKEAQAAMRDLWALPEAQRVPPWEWWRQSVQQRQKQRTSFYTEKTAQSLQSFTCGAKRYCKQMTSCAET